MKRYIVRRFLSAVVVLWIVSVVAFVVLAALPGEALVSRIDLETGLDSEQMAALRSELYLDKPLEVRYFVWLGNVLRGDLGTSLRTRQPVAEALIARLPVTLQLAVLAWVIGIAIAFPAGVLAARRHGTYWDLAATIWAVAGVAAPGFWIALLLILVFAVGLRWLPPVGYISVFQDPIAGLRSSVLPALSLGVGLAAVQMRQLRSALLEVWGMDYINVARAKGLRENRILMRHALRNAMLPVLTVLGLQVANLLGGAVIIETIFGWPGVGRMAVDGIGVRDYPAVMGVVLFAAVVVTVSNLVVDILYAVVDPRIRYQ
jgi:peptide/nickel transport system permease protein